MPPVPLAEHHTLHEAPRLPRPAAREPLTGVGPRLAVAELELIVGGLASATDLWRPYLRHDEVDRARVRLLETAAYEVWLLGWLPGQGTGLHDHGGSNAAFTVVDGELEVVRTGGTDAHQAVSPVGHRLERQPVPATTTTTLPAGHVHLIENRSAAPAASLHVYSRPLRSMGHFEAAGDRCGHRLRTAWVEQTTAAISGA